MIAQYFWNHLWALDRWLNVLLGGSSKEFISTRVFEYKDKNIVAGWMYQILNWIDKDHCERAAIRDYALDHSSDAVLK